MPTYFDDAEHELDALYRNRARRSRVSARLGWRGDLPTEEEGARVFVLTNHLMEYADRYPWLKPQVMTALAEAGIASDSRAARLVAEAGARIEADSGLFFREPGESVEAGRLALRTLERGEGVAYAGAEDAAVILANLEEDPRFGFYEHRPGAKSENERLSRYDPRSGLTFSLDPTSDPSQRQFVGDSPDFARAQEEARKTIEELGGQDLSSLRPSDHTRLGSANFVRSLNEGEYRAQAASWQNPLTPALRTGFMVLDAPLQEIQGQFRNVVSSVRDQGLFGALGGEGVDIDYLESQSDLGVAIGRLAGGEEVDVGSGLFVDPESDVRQELVRRQRERGLIGGHAITPGRLLADTVFEPGSKPFTLLSGVTDLVVAVGADPAGIALTKVGRVRQANKMFTEAGGLFGLRRTISSDAARAWHAGEDGLKLDQWLADHGEFLDVWNGLGRKVSPALADELANADNVDDVHRLIARELGTSLVEKPNPEALNLVARRSLSGVRLAGVVPGPFIDGENPYQAVVQVERFLRNVKADVPTIYDFTKRMAQAPDIVARFGVVMDMLGSTKGVLVSKFGVAPHNARRLTRSVADDSSDMRKWFVNEIGDDAKPWPTQMLDDGEMIEIGGPHGLVEHIDRLIPLPNARDLRRATSPFRHILESSDGTLRMPISTALLLQEKVWKPAVLLRGAWTLRVIAEEQLRMAAMGMTSAFRHPISHIALVMGQKKATGVTGDFLKDADQHISAMSQGMRAEFGRPGMISVGFYDSVEKTPEKLPTFMQGWGGELIQLNVDPIYRAVARSSSLAHAKDVVWNNMRAEREMLARAGPRGHPELLTREGSDHYVEQSARRISIKTGDHPELVEAVRTGRLGGVSIQTAEGVPHLNPAFVRKLDDYLDAAPQAVKAEKAVYAGRETADKWDRAVDWSFGWLMAKPTNWLSRSPTWKTAYWNHVETVLPFADIDAQQAIIAAAKKAGIGGGELDALKAARRSTGELSVEEVDVLAKGHALDFTKQLLYDLSERSQFFDVSRLLFPFGEAWKEVGTRWARIIKERPQTARRFQQGIQAARGEELGGLMGAPVGEGFFFQNDRGEEVFVYPGSQFLTSKLLGVPIPMVGRVQGLNMVGEVWPSLGPMMQVPASWFMPDRPTFDSINEFLFPFGRPEGGVVKRVTSAFTPAWVKRWLTQEDWSSDPDTIRLWNNSVMDVASHLVSTGDYDVSTSEGMQELFEDARSKADGFHRIRAVAQFFAPSAPAPEWMVEDKYGNLVQTSFLMQEYRKLQEEDYDTAAQTFLDRFGVNTFLTMQSKTHPVVFGYPVTEDGVDWLQANPDMKVRYPSVYGFFAPQGGDFSYPSYLRSINDGARQPLTADQFVKLGNARLAALRYDAAVRRVEEANQGRGRTDEQRAWLRQMREALIAEYPGYRESLGLIRRAEPEQMLRELQTAVNDPVVKGTDAGRALARYLESRDRAQAEAERRGFVGFQTSASTRDLRDWLRRMGESLSTEHSDFAPLFDQVLDREMADDIELAEAA